MKKAQSFNLSTPIRPKSSNGNTATTPYFRSGGNGLGGVHGGSTQKETKKM